MLTNENGSTLLTVVIISVVFLLLGMSVLTSTVGSIKRTESRNSEISITYNSIESVDAFTTLLAQNLDSLHLKNFRKINENNKIEVSLNYSNYLNTEILMKSLEEFLDGGKTTDLESISCINIIELNGQTSNYLYKDPSDKYKEIYPCLGDLNVHKDYSTAFNTISDSTDFTRIYDLVIITKNPISSQINVGRLTTKRYLLSPIPSFLRYTVGSNGQLILNGSSHIVGDVFTNELSISSKAKYSILTNNSHISQQTTNYSLSPSIYGDLYSRTAQPLSQLIFSNFYKGNIPNLYHDSQFTNINFDETFNERSLEAMTSIVFNESKKIDFLYSNNWKDNFTNNLRNLIKPSNNYVTPNEVQACLQYDAEIDDWIIEENCYNLTLYPSNGQEIINESSPIKYNQPIYTDGDLTILVNYPIQFNNTIFVNGNLTIITMYPQTFNNKIITTGNLNIIANDTLHLNDHIIVGENLIMSNRDSELTVTESIVTGKNISISSTSLGNNDTIIKLNKNILSGSDTTFISENSNIEILGNLFIDGDLTITGNEEIHTATSNRNENDTVTFSSVVYVTGETTISNTNILTANNNTGNLVLMTKGNLLITRINEFNKYLNISELNTTNLLPAEEEAIKPLKGFFYTESEAELYGVGSLFYVHGGIFAKNQLTINAVRGNTSYNTNEITDENGENKLSRFIVKYDDSVLYNRINALPIVNTLQLYMAETSIK